MKLFSRFIKKEFLTIQDADVKLSVFSLALPIFFDFICGHLIMMVQTMLSSHYEGGFFVIALSVPSTVLSLFITLTGLFSTGMGILLNVFLGRHETDACKKVFSSTLVGGIFFSLLISIIGFLFAEPLLNLMGLNNAEYQQYAPYAIQSFHYQCFFLMITSATNIFTTVLRCYGYTKISLYRGIASNGFSVLATALAMYVFRMPKDIAVPILSLIALFSSLLGFLIVVIVFKKQKIPFAWNISGKALKKVIKIGLPASISGLFYSLSVTVTSAMCLQLPPAAYLANNYINKIVYFTYIFGYSIGQANSLMLGRVCGMGNLDWADKMHKENLKIALFSNGLLGILFAILGRPLLQLLFNADATVSAYASILFIDILVELGRGMNHIGQFGLNATGDVHFTTLISIVSCWTCSIGLAYVLGIALNLGLYGFWIAFAVDELFRGTLYLLRWLKKDWQKRFQRLI